MVTRKVHGALMIRMRKIGYAPYMGSFDMLAEREDTSRMSRLPQGLSAVQITEASGFGRDTFVYKDLDQRMRWRNHLSSVITREDLAKAGRESLCEVTGCGFRDCVILDGGGRTTMRPRHSSPIRSRRSRSTHRGVTGREPWPPVAVEAGAAARS